MARQGRAQQAFRIVLVEPEYEINLGAACRAMANFGFSELVLVNPRCDPVGFDAVMHSKHAVDVLRKARTCGSLKQAVKGCKFVVGTTGVLRRHKHTLRNPLTLPEFAKRKFAGNIALLFGREGIGLSESEIDQCDALVTIPTDRHYPVMNLSHAIAVVLYAISGIKVNTISSAKEKEKEHLIKSFDLLVTRYSHEMRNPHKVRIAFRRVLGRAVVSDVEARCMMGVLRRAGRELGERKLKSREK